MDWSEEKRQTNPFGINGLIYIADNSTISTMFVLLCYLRNNSETCHVLSCQPRDNLSLVSGQCYVLKMTTQGGVTRTCYTKILGLSSSKKKKKKNRVTIYQPHFFCFFLFQYIALSSLYERFSRYKICQL